MAKDKTKPADSLLNDMLKTVEGHPAAVAEAETDRLTKALAASEAKAAAFEAYVLSMLEDLDYARKFFGAAQKPAGVRYADYYVRGRELCGEAGQAIDRKIRGV